MTLKSVGNVKPKLVGKFVVFTSAFAILQCSIYTYINTAESPYCFTIMCYGRKKSTAAPLTSQWAAMMAQSFVSRLVYIFSLSEKMDL